VTSRKSHGSTPAHLCPAVSPPVSTTLPCMPLHPSSRTVHTNFDIYKRFGLVGIGHGRPEWIATVGGMREGSKLFTRTMHVTWPLPGDVIAQWEVEAERPRFLCLASHLPAVLVQVDVSTRRGKFNKCQQVTGVCQVDLYQPWELCDFHAPHRLHTLLWHCAPVVPRSHFTFQMTAIWKKKKDWQNGAM
jgi:hypothetical protein